ncbi:MAG: hypothetical protein ABSD59_09465 [Terracidiphilus sp.]
MDELGAGIEKRIANVPLFRLHVVDIAVDMTHARMIHLREVAFGIGNGVHETDFGGADGLDGGLDAVFHKEVAAHGERFSGTLELDVVAGLGPADGACEGNFAVEVIDGRLAAYSAIEGEIVVGGEHAADARDFDAVVTEDLERLIHFVAEVRAVVVAVQLDVGNLGLGETCC